MVCWDTKRLFKHFLTTACTRQKKGQNMKAAKMDDIFESTFQFIYGANVVWGPQSKAYR